MQYVWQILCSILCVSPALPAVERPWLQLNDPTAEEVAARFQSPPPENGMTLWWGWDGAVNREVITRDLDRIKAMGFTCVMMEAGNRMEAKYLSPAWFDLFAFAVDQARQRDMRLWVEDEGKYPSGFVGGKFTEERPDLRMQALVQGETVEVSAGETVSRNLGPDTICAVATNLDNHSHRVLEVRSGELTWTVPPGRWRISTVQHAFRTGATRSVNNPKVGAKDTTHSLCDYLNPEATRQIIAWTHEGYRKAAGEEFGRTFMGFMGDEPDYYGITPWTPRMLEEFQARKGYDVRPFLWAIASNPRSAPPLTDEQRRAKADYWAVWSDLYAQNYFKVLADWCAAHGVEYIVHLNNEDRLTAFVRGGGDFFKNMRHVGIPGVDAIWAQIWPDHVADYPKMASSAAHLFGRPHAFTESFAAFTNPVDVPTAKWVIDYQLVRGINLIQVMFMSASSGGRGPGPASTPSPASPANPNRGRAAGPGGTGGPGPGSGAMGPGGRPRQFFTTPEFPPVARYVHRAAYLLSMGRPAAEIGVYVPTTSVWLGDTAADQSSLAIAQRLLEGQRDFDWVDEQALSSVLRLEGSELKNLSGQGYRAILVPAVTAISKAALARLEAFAKAGGRVVFLGKGPSMVVEQTFLKAGGPPDLGWATLEPSGEVTPRVLDALPRPDVALDRPCPTVKVQHRRWLDADLYFLFNEGDQRQACTASLAGTGQVQVWDAATGRIESLARALVENGRAGVSLDLGPRETRFIVIQRPAL